MTKDPTELVLNRTWRAALALAHLMNDDSDTAAAIIAERRDVPRNYFWVTVMQVQAMTQRSHRRPARPDPQPPSTLRLPSATDRRIQRIGHDPSGPEHLGQHVVDLAVAQQGGHALLVLVRHSLPSAPARDVQRIANIEQVTVCRVHSPVRPVRQPGSSQRGEHRHIP